MSAVKTVCPISRQDFRANAKPILVKIGDREFIAEPKEFSTNGLGWNISEKTLVQVNGTAVKVQIGLNLSIIGSKEAQ